MTPLQSFHHHLSISLLFWLSISTYPTTTHSGGNSCNRLTFEKCIKGMIMMADPGFIYPTSLPEMNTVCHRFKVNHACAKNYTQNCLTGETKNTLSLSFYGFAKANRANCATKKRKEAQAALGRCANLHSRDITKALGKMNRKFHGIKVHPNAKERIPMICCNYYAYKQTILRAISRDCTQAEVNGLEAFVDGFTADSLSFACGDYTEDSDKCAPLMRKIPEWKKPLDTPIFFLTIVDILLGL